MSHPFLSLAILAAVLAVSSGCVADTLSEDAPEGEAGAGFESVTIEHKYGSTDITERPERAGLTEQDFERVAALSPDLIVALHSGISESDYDLYAAIAPTIAQPADTVDYGVSWQTTTRTLGRALGQPDEAERLVADVEQRIEQEAQSHPEFAGEAAMATIYAGIFVYGSEDPRGRLLVDLGFTFPAQLADVGRDEFGASLSPERAELVDLGTLVWLNEEGLVDETAPTNENLTVSTDGRDVFVAEQDPLYEATSFVSVLSLPYLLDGLVPRLEAAADGDPASQGRGSTSRRWAPPACGTTMSSPPCARAMDSPSPAPPE